MIFDENFDRALWLLVASNKSDSDKVCRLISCIPKSVYLEIQVALYNYYNCGMEVKNNIVFETNLNNIDGFDYYIIVKVVSDKLFFKVLRWSENKERIEEEYKLVLMEIFSDYLADMEYGDKRNVGKYTYEINNIHYDDLVTLVDTESYDRSYILTKVPFGFILTGFIKKIPIKKKYVNVFKNIPEELCVDDFSSKEKIEGLVKKRKKTRK